MRWIRTTLMLTAAALAGCATNAPPGVLAEGPRMIDLYRGTPVVPEDEAVPRAREASEPEPVCRWWLFAWPCERTGLEPEARNAEVPSHTRTAANELELLFPRLPNPDVYIHVLPHLATEARVPVPGYTTAVPLYERVEYALPGELDHAMRLLEPVADVEDGGADAPPAEPEGTP